MTQVDLLKLNVNEHTEKKNGLTYLSWAWAWAKALIADPAATFEVKMFGDNPYMVIGDTAMVWVTMTMFGKPMTCMLPVMDNKNAPISVKGRQYKDKYNKDQVSIIDSFNVNTAIMRCLVKAIALHGLGLYIYAGEDLPEEPRLEPEPEPKPELKPETSEKLGQSVQKAVKSVAKAVGTPEQEKAAYDAKMVLFGEVIVEYLKLNTTDADLVSYWKKNQGQLDQMKASHPDLYSQVLIRFSEARAKMKEAK
jgi:hypothetical protein